MDTNTKLKMMKTKSQFWRKLLFASLMLVGTAIVFTACDDDEELGALPSLNISNETAQNATSNTVSTTVSFDASEGAKELIILKNGLVYKTEALNGQKSGSYLFEYTISETLGAAINFTFQVVDNKDRASSTSPVFSVNVTAKPIRVVQPGNYLGEIKWYSDTIYHLHGYVRIGRD